MSSRYYNPPPPPPPPYPSELGHEMLIGGRADLSAHRVPADKIDLSQVHIDNALLAGSPFPVQNEQTVNWGETTSSEQILPTDTFWPY